MIQLICHLVGDYALQSHVMATRKTSSLPWALIHAVFYTLPFLFLTHSPSALAIICLTHALIDRFAIARHWCEFYGVGFPGIWQAFLEHDWIARKDTNDLVNAALNESVPFPDKPSFTPPPPFLGVWLIIIVDNTMHLAINYAALWAFP